MYSKKFIFKCISYVLIQAIILCLTSSYVEAAEGGRNLLSPALSIKEADVQYYFTMQTKQQSQVSVLNQDKATIISPAKHAKTIFRSSLKIILDKQHLPKKIYLIVKKYATLYGGRIKKVNKRNFIRLLREGSLIENNEQIIFASMGIIAVVLGMGLMPAGSIAIFPEGIIVGLTFLIYFLENNLKESPVEAWGLERAGKLRISQVIEEAENDQAITFENKYKRRYVVLPDDAIPVPVWKLEGFFSKYSYYQEAYHHEYNPVYPSGGCGSFSGLVGEAMIKELFDMYVMYSGMRDHYYLSAAVEFADGRIDEVIIDYTADQLGYGQIAPLVGTREFIKRSFPEAYNLFYAEASKIMRPNEILQDNFFSAFIQIVELTDELKEQKRDLQSIQEPLADRLINKTPVIYQNSWIDNAV